MFYIVLSYICILAINIFLIFHKSLLIYFLRKNIWFSRAARRQNKMATRSTQTKLTVWDTNIMDPAQ